MQAGNRAIRKVTVASQAGDDNDVEPHGNGEDDEKWLNSRHMLNIKRTLCAETRLEL